MGRTLAPGTVANSVSNHIWEFYAKQRHSLKVYFAVVEFVLEFVIYVTTHYNDVMNTQNNEFIFLMDL